MAPPRGTPAARKLPASPRRAAPRPAPGATPADARLLAVAGEHLRRLGPARVTVVAVAAEVGLSHAAVYRYFPSRLALVEAVAERWLKEVETALVAIADAPDPAQDKLERLLVALARAQRRALACDPHLFAVYLAAAAQSRAPVRRHRHRLRLLLERVLDEGVATGAFRMRDRDRAVAFIFDAAHRFIHPVAVNGDAEMPPDVVDARLAVVTGIVLRALRAGVV